MPSLMWEMRQLTFAFFTFLIVSEALLHSTGCLQGTKAAARLQMMIQDLLVWSCTRPGTRHERASMPTHCKVHYLYLSALCSIGRCLMYRALVADILYNTKFILSRSSCASMDQQGSSCLCGCSCNKHTTKFAPL